MRQHQLVVCVGAAKAGTTTLFELMRRHPSVAVTSIKETNFFFDDAKYQQGYPAFLETYLPSRAGRHVLFEADPAYMCSARSLQRIKDCAPDAKLIFMLRNPAERSFSQWLYRVQMGRAPDSFLEALAEETEHLDVADDASINEWGYLERSRYGKYIERAMRLFPRGQLYFLVFEKLIADEQTEATALCKWLGIPAVSLHPAAENRTVGRPRSKAIARLLYDPRLRWLRRFLTKPLGNSRLKSTLVLMVNRLNSTRYMKGERPELDPNLWAHLMSEFESDIALTENLTGLDLRVWPRLLNEPQGRRGITRAA